MTIQQPIRVGTLELHNRLVMPPMYMGKCTDDGLVTDELCQHYRQRAEGGAIGMIILEHAFICQPGKAGPGQLSAADDACIPGLARLVDTIHAYGTKVFAQLNHGGSSTHAGISGYEPVSASPVVNPGRKAGVPAVIPHELTREEILELQEQFVQAALRVKAAGCDGVEIHSAHGYLLNQFYSPITNHRADEYGCASVENRTRFQVEVLRKVRTAVGPEYPIAIRLGGCDYQGAGSTIDDAVEACRLFEAAGADLIDLSGGLCRYVRADHTEPGYFADMSAPVKAAVQIPVLLAGGVTEIGQAEQLLNDGKADLIGVGRALLKEPTWAADAMASL